MSSNQLLQEAITAARSGRRKEAYDLLVQLVQADEANEAAWLWLSGVAEDPEEQRLCLENVLHLNPDNTHARKGLAQIEARSLPQQPNSHRESPAAAPSAVKAVPPPPPPAPSPPPFTPQPLSSAAAPVSPFARTPPLADIIPLPTPEHPCPFCGAATAFEQKRCPVCKKELMVRATTGGLRSQLGLGQLQRLVVVVEEREHVVHYNYGIAYKERGMWFMAAKEWEGAVKKRPREVKYRHALGLAYAQLKHFDRAIAALKDALTIEPNNKTIQNDIALIEQLKAKGKP